MEDSGHHYVAIFGGSVSGSEAAHLLAERGFRVAVFDQNYLPYGKIEDGLPKWHAKLRDKEEATIDDKLSHENITFIPGVRLGKELDFNDIAANWGFSAVLLATGAWKDRSLPIMGIDDYVDKGLVYQNPFIHWFNHYHESGYQGQAYEIPDGAIVVGGGLASLDVVKVVMIETVQKALKGRGIDADMFTLERSIAKVLDEHHLTMDDLGLKGCTLYYRREAKHMPLSTFPRDTPEHIAKAESVNQKILENFVQKYLFNFQPCAVPHEKIVENGGLKGIVFQKTKIVGEKAIPVEGEFIEQKTELVISSIGSMPEKIDGIPQEGNLFKLASEESCRIDGFENVFALGNAVTGRGNIKESLEHGKYVTLDVMDHHFHWMEEDYQKWLRGVEGGVEKQISEIASTITRQRFLSIETLGNIKKKISELHHLTGYKGNYREWIEEKRPVRLESILEDH